MPQPNAHLTLRLSPVTSNRDPERYLSLVIEDATSGLRVAQFELLGEHLVELLSGRTVGGHEGMPAWLIEPAQRSALGCHRFTTDHRFPVAHYAEEAVEQWAKRTSGALDAASYSVFKNNAGVIVATFTYYTNATLPEQVETIRQERQATMTVAATACVADR